MHIAFVSQPWNRVRPPVESGSIAIWTYQVARRLAPDRRVTVYARGGGRLRAKEQEHEGVAYRHMPTLADRALEKAYRATFHKRDPHRPRFASLGYHAGYALAVALDLRRRGADVVHVPNLSQFPTIIRALNPKAKIVLHMHCYWLTQLDPDLVRRRLRHVDLVLGCSESVTEPIRKAFPEVADRCATVYNGFNAERFGVACAEAAPPGGGDGAATEGEADAPRLLCVGRVSPEKGIHVLLEAFERVAARHPQARLDVVGPNSHVAPLDFVVGVSEDPAVRGLAAFYGEPYLARLERSLPASLRGRVRFTGAVPHSELAEAYGQADLLVNASLTDTFPMPILEAMACGVPAVATDVGGAVESVVEGETGLLVPSDDPDVLAEAVGRLLDDPALRHRMGEAGHRRAPRFTWEKTVEALLAEYARIEGRP